MCGIVGYIVRRKKRASETPIKSVLTGLKRLEERGYDQVGLCVIQNRVIESVKSSGKIDSLGRMSSKLKSTIAMGHTRWATHGKPKLENCHPHLSNDSQWAVCHNGVIENYAELKEQLVQEGYVFQSETDTEVIPMLLQKFFEKTKDPMQAIRSTIGLLRGSYALIIITSHAPNKLICVKYKSPLVIGIGSDAFMASSDEKPLVGYCSQVLHLNDGELAIFETQGAYSLLDFSGKKVKRVHCIKKLTLSLEEISKGTYKTFMEKEIHEQEKSILACMKGRIDPDNGLVRLHGLIDYLNTFKNAKRITILGCGTSWHAGMIGQMLFEKYARIPTTVEIASEWRYRDPVINYGDIIIGISQSGETADTNQALSYAKERGAIIFGICNTESSSMTNITSAGVFLHIGKETSVASTKAFTAQLNVLILMALTIAQERGTIGKEDLRRFLQKQSILPSLISETLGLRNQVKKIARVYRHAKNTLFLGRGLCYPVALEGALKVKEVSGIHAEGISLSEMKHGPIALINKNMPVVIIAPDNILSDKVLANVKQVEARDGQIIAIISKGDDRFKKIARHTIEIPPCDEILQPIISSIPLQLFALYSAELRGKNVDQPENLAKTVTVE